MEGIVRREGEGGRDSEEGGRVGGIARREGEGGGDSEKGGRGRRRRVEQNTIS